MPEFSQTPEDLREKDFPYFRRLWNTIVIALLAAAFIPLVLIGGGMYFFAGTTLKQKTMESLRAEVLNHKNAVDLFLTERALDLKQLAGTAGLVSLTLPGTLAAAFQSLQASGDKPWFTDLGIIDDQGRHRAFVGPYDLISKNYNAALWFKAVMERGKILKIRSLAAKDEMSAETREALLESLDQIRTETHRGIKSLDRIHSVTQPLASIIKEIDVNILLDGLIRLFAREMHFKNIKIIKDFYNQPLPIRSDPSQVSQVFQNLMFNAIFALQKDGMIILKTRRRNRGIQAVVVDNGPGIAEENLERIFKPFFTTKPDGMGLGLTVCRNILETLGGKIRVGSKPGKGAAFTVELPFEFRTPNPDKPELTIEY